MIRKTPDDSDRNYDIVHMIKKIAIGLESKNVDDLRAIAHELEAWVPHGNWGKLDVKTKVFVEHILIALARLQLGFEIIDKCAEELTDIRQKVEKDEIHDLMDEAEYDELEREMNELAQKTTRENIDVGKKREKVHQVLVITKKWMVMEYAEDATEHLEIGLKKQTKNQMIAGLQMTNFLGMNGRKNSMTFTKEYPG